MQRNLKALGLALAAAFALSAVAASAASAVTHEFHSSIKNTRLTAKSETHQVFKATPDDTKAVVCGQVNVSGTLTGNQINPNTFAAESVSVKPEYTECGIYEPEPGTPTANFKASVTVDTNTCEFKFTGETTETEGVEGEHAFVHLEGCTEPEDTKGITVTVSALNRPCIHIESEQTLHGIKYKNQTTSIPEKEEITIEATVTGIASHTTSFALVCPVENEEETTHDNGTYTGNISLTGYSDEAHENQVNLTVFGL